MYQALKFRRGWGKSEIYVSECNVYSYLLTGYRICCVVGDSKYREYAFAPAALHLQHPVSRYIAKKAFSVMRIHPGRGE